MKKKIKAWAVINNNSSKKIQGLPILDIYTTEAMAKAVCKFWDNEMWADHSSVVEVTITYTATDDE